MKLRQISIFIENRSGSLAEVTGLLAKENINIRVSSLADTLDFGIIRFIVNDVDRALQILRDNQYTVSVSEMIAVEVPDTPGGLAEVLSVLDREGLNISYLYGFVARSGVNAIFIFRFEQMDRALEVIQAHGLKILSGEDLHSL